MQTLEAQFQEAVALQRQGELPRSIALYRRILEAAPDLLIARDNLCLALLAAGDYREGFGRYDVRFEREPPLRVERPTLPYPEWRGEPLAGRSILIWSEQGFGDEIMYARFVRSLAALGARVSILARPPLARLFGGLPAQVIRAEGATRIAPHDYWLMLASLPARLGITLETLPGEPYLPVAAERGGGLGVMWVGRATPDPLRSLPPEAGAELLALPGARSLHPEDTGARDFQDTAEIVAGLDSVITVDTAVAHLAGAMGKRTAILLPFRPDWRWMWGRSDTPWYPTARLFRQPIPGHWRTPIDAARDWALRSSP